LQLLCKQDENCGELKAKSIHISAEEIIVSGIIENLTLNSIEQLLMADHMRLLYEDFKEDVLRDRYVLIGQRCLYSTKPI
jgi:hypothetical protein